MDINIQVPHLLWLLLGNLLFIGIPLILKKKKSYYYIALRMIVYTLIVIALSGVVIKSDAMETHTILLIDRSDSMRTKNEEVRNYINEQLRNKPESEFVEIIAFGEDAAIEQLMTQGAIYYEERVIINQGGTNLEEALLFAKNRFDHEKNKRLLVISDFIETSGDLLESLVDETGEGIEYKHFIPENLESRDSQITSVTMPRRVDLGESFPVAVSIYSNNKTDAKLTIFSDDKIVVQKDITLDTGMQRFVFEDSFNTTGNHQYVARIQANTDTVEANNQWHNIVEVEGSPTLLVIDPKNEGALFEELLRKQGILTTRMTHNSIDYSLEGLSNYDGVVLINASIETLSTNFLTALDLYVKELGGGLLTIGGSESYAVGGYEETVLEELLPVNMALKVEGERYDLAMMTVIDKSGSMASGENGPSKMKMAKEAVMRVATTLSSKDQLGLIAFDGQPYEVFPLMEVGDMDTIAKSVAGVKADGGTSILPALKDGLEALDKSTLKGKHLLLVSDGQGEQRGYEALIAAYGDVTISTIAIGGDADGQTMKRIAEYGNGRFYQVTDYKKIPEIFTKETRLAMDEFIKEGLFVPVRNSRHDLVNGIVQLPIVYGYVGTSIKPESQLILSLEEEPLLALWQYGLGKSMAWTSDVSSWTRAYYEQEQGVQLLTDLPSTIFSTQDFSSIDLDVEVANNTLIINGYQSDERVLAVDMISSEGEPTKIDMTQFSDGYFDGTMAVPDEGFVFLRVKDSVTNELLLQSPIAINYSKEYDHVSTRDISKEYKALVNSDLLDKEAFVFTEILNQTQATKSIENSLIIIALLLFIVDVASRKLRFDPIQRIMDKNRQRKLGTSKRIVASSESIKTNKETSKSQSVENNPKELIQKDSSVIDTGRLLSKKRKRD